MMKQSSQHLPEDEGVGLVGLEHRGIRLHHLVELVQVAQAHGLQDTVAVARHR